MSEHDDTREPFPVTNDVEDAPDGSVICEDDSWWERSGMMWHPVTYEEALRLQAQARREEGREPNCSCDQRGRNISCTRCKP